MADKISVEQRRKNMQAIKSVSQLENLVSKELWGKNFRYRRNVKDLYGKPDIAIKKYKIVIFIDSCFWHQCPLHANKPKTNTEFWEKKLNKNIERDIEVTNYYKEKEWKILRIWEHEVKGDFDAAINKIANFINEAKRSSM